MNTLNVLTAPALPETPGLQPLTLTELEQAEGGIGPALAAGLLAFGVSFGVVLVATAVIAAGTIVVANALS